MDRSTHERDGGSGHGVLQMLLGCGLMLAGFVVLSTAGAAWGVPLLLAALTVHLVPLMLRRRPADHGEPTTFQEGMR